MSISRALKTKFDSFNAEGIDRVIRMAWEDRTSYTAITKQFNLSASEIVHFMRYHLEESKFKRWRKRIFEKGALKNSPHKNYRFKCSSQRMDGSTKNHK